MNPIIKPSSNKNVHFLNRKLFSIIPILLGVSSFFWPILLPNLEDYVLKAGNFCIDQGTPEKTKEFCDNQRGVAKAVAYIIFPFIFFIFSNWVVLYLEEVLVAYKTYKQRRSDRRETKQLIDNFSTKVTENLDVHLRRLSDGHRLTEIGDAVESLKSIKFEMQNADMVRNTFVTFKDSEAYEDEAESVYSEYFEKDRERHWEDLISYPEVFSRRFKMKLDADVVGTRHHVRILRHNVPLINFMILYKNDEPISAYIGWIHAERARGPIFATRDKKLTRLLDRHFEKLWKGKTFRGNDVDSIGTTISVNYYKSPGKRFAGIDLVRKFGKWITLSFSIDDKGEIIQYSLGIICVDLKEGSISLRGQIRRGSILRTEENHGSQIDISFGRLLPINIVQTANKLYFDYSIREYSENPGGFCMYSFVERNHLDAIEGFHVNEKSRVRRDVVGIRISHDQNEGIYPEDFNISQDAMSSLLNAARLRAIQMI